LSCLKGYTDGQAGIDFASEIDFPEKNAEFEIYARPIARNSEKGEIKGPKSTPDGGKR
jgi:hypothetical protein